MVDANRVKRWFAFRPGTKWTLFLFGFVNVVATFGCPGVCFCPTVSRYVHCSRKNLPFIPSGISNDTTHLYLNENNFQNPNLSRSNFTYLTSLEQLFLIECGIELIEVDTFRDLKKLKWLDISKNRLKIIYDNTFQGLHLDHLFLNDNPGMVLSTNAFQGLQAMGLYIHNCAIADINIDHIKPLNGTLKSLWLDGNKLEYFKNDWKYLFNTLSYVRLGNNPLHCNCEIKWLYSFYVSHDTMFAGVDPPSCLTPPRLRGKSLNFLTEQDFRCQLPVFKTVDVIFVESLGKLTCLASGDPVPTIIWVKPDKTKEVYAPKEIKDTPDDNEGVLYLSDPQSEENVKYQCIAKNPAGNVTFTLSVRWPPSFSQDFVQDPGIIESKPTPEIHTPHNKQTHQPRLEQNATKGITKNKEQIVINAGQSSGISQVASNEPETEVVFSILDIVGAVVGTFLLTLLACIVIFHIFHRHQERFFYRDQNGVNETRANNKHLVTDVRNENVKMLQNNHCTV
ncbi:leucine-rich repeat and fibronectin type-III domain-containing protein 5-like [Pecten maximus]|uniref:leucine-rich repeat and fibronectin type-III domain-containing protein 5-like n=1 Tax=Pecten maximus TaxID=6579 RepID=UPI0014587D9E|nr:leucine-rich repeat and fibronectin type-III domain-containing protein 5-like [Pecten maximus]